MKSKIVIFLTTLILISTSLAQNTPQMMCDFSGRNVKSPTLPIDIKLTNPPKLSNKDSFSVILFGDPQGYSKYKTSQSIFDMMTAWTAQQKKALNIMTVLCTGDLVDNNSMPLSNGNSRYAQINNQPSTFQWEAVSRAFKRLDNVYPYILATGNHEYGLEASESRNSEFPKYFDVSRNHTQWEKHLISYCPNAFGKGTLENAAYEFYHHNWGDILILTLEFSPRDEVVEWAKKLCLSKKFTNHKVIILTHSILSAKGELIQKENYKSTGNFGQQIYDKLLKKSPNIKLAICGHTNTVTIMSAFRKEKREDGGNISIMMFNPQSISGHNGNGGEGWLRILEFKPDGKTISVSTYSPIFAFSKKTEHLSWENSPEHKFDIVIE